MILAPTTKPAMPMDTHFTEICIGCCVESCAVYDVQYGHRLQCTVLCDIIAVRLPIPSQFKCVSFYTIGIDESPLMSSDS